jgi:cytoskeletal protein CcmA (bactofilin family)
MFRRGEGEDRHDQQDRHERHDRHDRRDQGAIQPSEVRHGQSGDPGSEVTVVGRGARIEGNLISAGSLRIDGQVKGKITAEGDVSLSPQSEVQADIDARNVVVAGTFKGNIVAANRAELAKGGRVDGNLTSKVLVVAEGATFTGQSVMDGSRSASGPEGSREPAAASAQPQAQIQAPAQTQPQAQAQSEGRPQATEPRPAEKLPSR